MRAEKKIDENEKKNPFHEQILYVKLNYFIHSRHLLMHFQINSYLFEIGTFVAGVLATLGLAGVSFNRSKW